MSKPTSMHPFVRLHRLVLTAGVALLLVAPAATAFDIEPLSENPVLPGQFALGSSLVLAVRTDTNVAAPYQWYKDDKPIPGAISATLALANVSAADTGNYQVAAMQAGARTLSKTYPVNVLNLPASPVDTRFVANLADPYLRFPYVVRGPADDGSVLVTTELGPLTSYVRLKSNGQLDPTFSYDGAQGRVLASLPDGSLIVAKSPYRLRPDGQFAPLLLPAGFDASQPLTVAAIQPDGRLVIGQGTQLARLNADGSADTSFAYPNSDHVTVTDIVFDLHQRLLVTGSVLRGPSDYPPSEAYFDRLLSSGAKDPSFQTYHATREGEYWRSIYAVTPLIDDSYLALYWGRGGSALVRFRSDGTLDTAWRGLGNPNDTSVEPALLNLSYAVDPRGFAFVVERVARTLRRYVITAKGLELDRAFYPGMPRAADGTAANLGKVCRLADDTILVGGDFVTWDSHATRGMARLRNDLIAEAVPSSEVETSTTTPRRGDSVRLSLKLTSPVGTGPFTYRWIGLDGQPMPLEVTGATLVLSPFTSANFGRYQAVVSNAAGSALSVPVTLDPNLKPVTLANLSGRAAFGTGENTVVAGVSTSDRTSSAVPVLIRAAGPALTALGVGGALPNPSIDVFRRGNIVANNDQWWLAQDVATASARVGAFAFGADSNDAALVTTASSGDTVHLRSQDGSSGIGLIEIYDARSDRSEEGLINLSLRARTAPGENATIAGFVVVDPQDLGRSARVLLRAVGPTLSASGIVNPLENPVLTVYNSKGEMVAQNDDWSGTSSVDPASVAAAAKTAGAFELASSSKDSALVLDLPAGAYSMHANGGTGVVLLEIYLLR